MGGRVLNEREQKMVNQLAGEDADQATKCIAEAVVRTASDITHEVGTEEATDEAIRITIGEFLEMVLQNYINGEFICPDPVYEVADGR